MNLGTDALFMAILVAAILLLGLLYVMFVKMPKLMKQLASAKADTKDEAQYHQSYKNQLETMRDKWKEAQGELDQLKRRYLTRRGSLPSFGDYAIASFDGGAHWWNVTFADDEVRKNIVKVGEPTNPQLVAMLKQAQLLARESVLANESDEVLKRLIHAGFVWQGNAPTQQPANNLQEGATT